MTSPITELSQITADTSGQGAAGQAEAAARNPHQETKAWSEGDTVTLSLSARVKKMKEEGASSNEIAERLSVDVKTVELYLTVTPASAQSKAHEMRLQGDSLSRIADQLGVDIKTVKGFLGIVPSPAATQAKQLEQQGESVIEIANRLGVDIRTVQRYLGIDHAATTKEVKN